MSLTSFFEYLKKPYRVVSLIFVAIGGVTTAYYAYENHILTNLQINQIENETKADLNKNTSDAEAKHISVKSGNYTIKEADYLWSVQSTKASYLEELRDTPAGFNCLNSGNKIEKLICLNSDLRVLDYKLKISFTKRLKQYETDVEITKKLRKYEDKWLTKTRNICEDTECLHRAYSDRLSALELAIMYNQMN